MFHAFCHMKLQQTVLAAKHEGVGDRFKIQALQVGRGIIFTVVQQSSYSFVVWSMSWPFGHVSVNVTPCNKETWRLWTDDIRSISGCEHEALVEWRLSGVKCNLDLLHLCISFSTLAVQELIAGHSGEKLASATQPLIKASLFSIYHLFSGLCVHLC